MALYTGVVVLATLIALPEDVKSGGLGTSHHDRFVVALVWGQTVGLAVAHWFAFTLAAAGFRRGAPWRSDLIQGMVEVGGACFVALVTTIVMLVVSEGNDVVVAAYVSGSVIAIAGYGTARKAERSVIASLVFGAVVLVAGLSVATLKAVIGH